MKTLFSFVSWTTWVIVWAAVGSFLVLGADRAAHAVQKTCSLVIKDLPLPAGSKPILGHKIYHSQNASTVDIATPIDVQGTNRIQLFAIGIETVGNHFVKVSAYNVDGETGKSSQIAITIDGVPIPPVVVLPGIPSAAVECP